MTDLNTIISIDRVCVVGWQPTDEMSLMHKINDAIDNLPEEAIVRDVKLYMDNPNGCVAMILWQHWTN